MFMLEIFYLVIFSIMIDQKYGKIGLEWEFLQLKYALFCIANSLHKKALTILTVSDSFITPEVTTSEQREKSFTEMMKIALEIA